ncbi:hypothetical protein BGZ98_008632 [Dissophora globulifera]|nr:hypothetical protein BGZ98_008632 [Dissophora globulifera]
MAGDHLYKFSLEVEKRASSENGKAILDPIDDTTGRSQQHDCVNIHLILNLILPAKAQSKFYHKSGMKTVSFPSRSVSLSAVY